MQGGHQKYHYCWKNSSKTTQWLENHRDYYQNMKMFLQHQSAILKIMNGHMKILVSTID